MKRKASGDNETQSVAKRANTHSASCEKQEPPASSDAASHSDHASPGDSPANRVASSGICSARSCTQLQEVPVQCNGERDGTTPDDNSTGSTKSPAHASSTGTTETPSCINTPTNKRSCKAATSAPPATQASISTTPPPPIPLQASASLKKANDTMTAAPTMETTDESQQQQQQQSSSPPPPPCKDKVKANKRSSQWRLPPLQEGSWAAALDTEFKKPYFTALRDALHARADGGEVIYPPADKVWAAFESCPLNKVRVVIIGQDPYIRPGQAEGLSFSVPRGVSQPPSLCNIFQEIRTDLLQVHNNATTTAANKQTKLPLGAKAQKTTAVVATAASSSPSKEMASTSSLPQIPKSGHLGHWADQGVLLLNSTLTVKQGVSNSHASLQWDTFTDQVIRVIGNNRRHVVFLLWGGYAKNKASLVNRTRQHLILTSAHPSPFSARSGFFGCRHFSTTNAHLIKHGEAPIDWLGTGFGIVNKEEQERVSVVGNGSNNKVQSPLNSKSLNQQHDSSESPCSSSPLPPPQKTSESPKSHLLVAAA